MKEEKKTTEEVEKKEVKKENAEKVETVKEEKIKETEKKSGKKIIIIALIVLIVIIIATVGGYFAYDYYERNKSVGTEWGDIYYSYLEEGLTATDTAEQMKHGILKKDGMENTTIQFVNLDQKEDPEMIMNYSVNGADYTNIYFKRDDNSVGSVIYFEKQDMQLLYNIEKQEYIYYAHSTNEQGMQTYISMPEKLEECKKTESDSSENLSTIYTFEEQDMPNEEVKEGEIPKISKFEETFIVPEVEESKKTSIDLNGNIKDIKNVVTETVEGFKPEEEIITEEVKTQVEEGKTELNNKKEEIKKAEEEKKRKEEEEAARKAAEEAAKGLKVGSHTLKYGKYTFSMNDGFSGKLTGTITLQPNGQFYIKSNFDESTGSTGSGLDCAGTYTVKLNVATGSPGYYSDGISFKTNTGKTFFHEVIGNNGFSDQWHEYTYAGN